MDTTLIPVMTRGYNDHEVGRIIQLGLERTCVRHLEIHTITYTGQGGVSFDRSGRISMHEVLRRIEETTGGMLRERTSCRHRARTRSATRSHICCLDPAGGPPVPFTRFMPREQFYAVLGERLYLEPSPRLETAMHDAIDRLWAFGGDEAERTLGMLKHLLAQLFPQGRVLSRAGVAAGLGAVGEGGLRALAHGRGDVRRRAGDALL